MVSVLYPISVEEQYADAVRNLSKLEQRIASPFAGYPNLERLRNYVITNIVSNGLTPTIGLNTKRYGAEAAVVAYAHRVNNDLGIFLSGLVSTPEYLIISDSYDTFLTSNGLHQVFLYLNFQALFSKLPDIPIVSDLEDTELGSLKVPRPHINAIRRYCNSRDRLANVNAAIMTTALVARLLIDVKAS